MLDPGSWSRPGRRRGARPDLDQCHGWNRRRAAPQVRLEPAAVDRACGGEGDRPGEGSGRWWRLSGHGRRLEGDSTLRSSVPPDAGRIMPPGGRDEKPAFNRSQSRADRCRRWNHARTRASTRPVVGHSSRVQRFGLGSSPAVPVSCQPLARRVARTPNSSRHLKTLFSRGFPSSSIDADLSPRRPRRIRVGPAARRETPAPSCARGPV